MSDGPGAEYRQQDSMEDVISQLRAEVERLTKERDAVSAWSGEVREQNVKMAEMVATLQRERDEARAEALAIWKHTCVHHNDAERKAASEVCPVCLRAQLAEREEDRALLDWIDAKTRRPWIHNAASGYTESFGPKSPYWGIAIQDRETIYGDTLRAAIRAARAQPEDGK